MRSEAQFKSRAERLFSKGHDVRAFLYSDYSIEAHVHDFYEMNIVLGGTGTHMIENSLFEVHAGDVFVIPPMIVHAYYDTKNLDVYHILIRDSFITKNKPEADEMPGFLQLIEIEPFLRRHFSDAMFLHLSGGQLEEVHRELKTIEDGGPFSDPRFEAFKQHTIWRLIYMLSYFLDKQLHPCDDKPSNKYERPILDALEHIHKHYSEKITVASLCKLTFLSRSTFLRSFEAICGCTPTQYLLRYRCSRAAELIESSGYSKTEIAVMSGFYDLSHMERALKN